MYYDTRILRHYNMKTMCAVETSHLDVGTLKILSDRNVPLCPNDKKTVLHIRRQSCVTFRIRLDAEALNLDATNVPKLRGERDCRHAHLYFDWHSVRVHFIYSYR
ncbi:hypothetical protein Avbf_05734 [Armadillidium vulgare]|nr:hypothetical protein Avbf_05734 [Armadillidium vulgare]